MRCTIAVARPDDVGAISEVAEASYNHYIARMGQRPGPMDTDYEAERRLGRLYALKLDATIRGFLVMGHGAADRPADLDVDNVALHPDVQGLGVFGAIVRAADWVAYRQGKDRLHIYTNVLMSENIKLYHSIGFTDLGLVSEHGFDRLYMQKPIFSEEQRAISRVVKGWRSSYGQLAVGAEDLISSLSTLPGLRVQQSSIGLRARTNDARFELTARPPEFEATDPLTSVAAAGVA